MQKNFLWGTKAKISYLLLAAACLLLTCLGSHEIWTQEHRWADIVSGMFFRQDFFHPFLGETDYYDKPLLSYWLMASVAFISGEVTTWALRLPSALAGILAVWSIYRLGNYVRGKDLGLLAGWMLLTTYYFIFWGRTSSADMLNMAGTLFAVSWYFDKKYLPSFFNYAVFFLVLACTALCKGLVAFAVAFLVILPDLCVHAEWRKHLRLSFVLALIPAIIVYVLPFILSMHIGGQSYHENGLYEVYRENVVRYFQPFDHKGPIYTYFVFLPVYLFPWVFFFVPALWSLVSRWRSLSPQSRWVVWAVLLLFLFFTLSGSRRNYYVLPIVPFALLMTADWLLSAKEKIRHWALWVAIVSFVTLFASFCVVQPIYYARQGMQDFSVALKNDAEKIKPWSEWQFAMLDSESKLRFYLHLAPEVKNFPVIGERSAQTSQSLLQAWPILNHPPKGMIFVSRQEYVGLLQPLLSQYHLIAVSKRANAPVAFVPESIK